MNTMALITIVSFAILAAAIIGEFVIDKPKNKLSVIFNYATSLAITFIGITLGLYFTGIDNRKQEKENSQSKTL